MFIIAICFTFIALIVYKATKKVYIFIYSKNDSSYTREFLRTNVLISEG